MGSGRGGERIVAGGMELEVDGTFQLRILHPSKSLQRQPWERTLFQIRSPVPPHGQRILNGMENARVKIELLTVLPWLCNRVLRGDPGLESALEPACLQALARLVMVQMAWKDSKSGKIPWNEPGKMLLMEKHLSDKMERGNIMRGRVMLRRRKMEGVHDVILVRQDRGRGGGQDKAFEPELDKTKFGHYFQSSSFPINATQPTMAVYTNSLTTATVSAPTMNIQQKGDDGDDKGRLGQTGDPAGGAQARKKNRMITSAYEKDPSTYYFLWDLVNMAGGSAHGVSQSQQDPENRGKKREGGSSSESGKNMDNKVNILRLIREALNTKYEDHVRKALRERDVKSLLCILALLTDQEEFSKLTTYAWHPSLPSTPGNHHYQHNQPSTSYMCTNHSAQTGGYGNQPQFSRKPMKQKRHRVDCQRQRRLDPNIISTNRQETTTVDKELPANQRSPDSPSFGSSYSHKESGIWKFIGSSLSVEGDSVQSDSDIQGEIWAILQGERANEANELRHVAPIFQEDTLDMDSLYLPSDFAVDDIETEIHFLQDSESAESGQNVVGDVQTVTEAMNIPQEDHTEETSYDERAHVTQVSLGRNLHPLRKENFLETQPLTSYALDLTLMQQRRVLSTHQELTEEESETKSEGPSRPPFPVHGDKAEKWNENEKAAKNTRAEDETMRENYWEAELRRSYQTVLNLLSCNVKARRWIEKCNLTDDDRACTDALKCFQFLFRGLCRLMEDRVATPMEENFRQQQRLREMWTSERRLVTELRALQAELRELEKKHIPYMLTLDFQIRILNSRLRKMSKEVFQSLREVVRETELNAGIRIKAETLNVSRAEADSVQCERSRVQLKGNHLKDYERFKSRRNVLHSLLEAEIAHYDEIMFQMQQKLDNAVAQTILNKDRVVGVQEKFADVESRYIDMCAEKKLKQIMKNMEMADELKRNRSAKIIQDCWRRYRIRKRKRERRKARKGKKKVPGGGGKKKVGAVQ